MQEENSCNQQQNPPTNGNPNPSHEETANSNNNAGSGQPPMIHNKKNHSVRLAMVIIMKQGQML